MLLFLAALLVSASCLSWTYTPQSTKQLRHIAIDAPPSSYISGSITATASIPISAWISDMQGTRVWDKPAFEDVVKFSFRSPPTQTRYILWVNCGTQMAGAASSPVDITVAFDINYDLFDTAQAQKLRVQPVAADLMHIERVIAGIVQKYDVISKDESLLRDANESINNRLSVFFFMTSVTLVGLMVWEVMYMMRFFKSKKLID